jgi:hypothetical protein
VKVPANSDNAVLLLAGASKLGLDKSVVQVSDGKLTAPDDVMKEAGFMESESEPKKSTKRTSRRRASKE